MIETRLYWQLPGPQKFIQQIGKSLNEGRGLWVNLPNTLGIGGIKEAIKEGTRNLHFDDPIELTINSGVDIAADVGFHFNKKRIEASQLAEEKRQHDIAIILLPEDDKAQEKCTKFLAEFLKTAEKITGNVQLITVMSQEPECLILPYNKERMVSFDGGLTQGEMEAYVRLRMINRTGPGPSRLYQTIISEFAGFDVSFAERLISLSDDKIINIRSHLKHIASDDARRWSKDSWVNGTRSLVTPDHHVLREQYFVNYGNDQDAKYYESRINQRFWRACLKEITPLIEQKKHELIAPFLPQIQALASGNSQDLIKVPRGNRDQFIPIDELEISNIVGMVKGNEIKATSPGEKAALAICYLAKRVRDPIAHMRAPKVEEVIDLLNQLDN